MTGCYNPPPSSTGEWDDMDFKLTNEQFDWLVTGSGYAENSVNLLRRHYVSGESLKELAAEAGFKSPARIYTLVKQFNSFVERKLLQHGLEMTVVINDREDRERILRFDIANREK